MFAIYSNFGPTLLPGPLKFHTPSKGPLNIITTCSVYLLAHFQGGG